MIKKIGIFFVIFAAMVLLPMQILASETVNKTFLTRAINSQYETGSRQNLLLTETNYTTLSWDVYFDTIEDAKDLEALLETTQETVDAMILQITTDKNALVFAGAAALATAKADAAALTEGDYTVASWGVVADAVALTPTTNEGIVAQTTAINNAVLALVFAGQADLNAAVLAANALNVADYTEATWLTLTNALEPTTSTNALVLAKTTAINNATTALVFAGAADLATAKGTIPTATQSDYTTASWEAITAANLLEETTNALVLAKTTAITNAVAGLVTLRSGLDQLVIDTNLITLANYTDLTSAAVTTALGFPEADNTEIADKIAAINLAVNQLITKADALALATAKADVTALTEGDYTVASWGAITAANLLTETTNALVIAKTTAINNAIDGLVTKVADNLATAKSTAAALIEDAYTTTSYAAVSAALDLSEETEALIITKTTEINDAITALVTVGDALTSVVTSTGLLTSTDYTEASWLLVTNALAFPETTNEEKVAKTTAITNAVAGLITTAAADALAAAVLAAEELDSIDFSAASWLLLTNALALPETTNALVLAKTIAINNAKNNLITPEAAGELALAKTNANLIETDYTTASWEAITAANLLEETTNALVIAKTAALNLAVTGLVINTNTTTLTNTINSKYTDSSSRTTLVLSQINYSETTWANYINSIASAKAVEFDWTSLQSIVNAAVLAMTTSTDELAFAGQEALTTAKGKITGLVSTDYTEDSWNAYTTAIGLTNEMPETTNAEVNAKTESINDVFGGLVFAGQANLNLAKAEAAQRVSTNYTTEAWALLTEALELLETTNALVVIKTTEINNVLTNLIFAGKADLNLAKSETELLIENDYTDASWLVLTEALDLIETTNALVETKTTAINEAINNLVFAGKAALDRVLYYANKKSPNDYTRASFAAMVTAMALPETTNAEILAKTAAINAKYKALVSERPTVTLTNYARAKIKVAWTTVSGARGYQIYRATSYSGKYSWANTIKGKSYISTLTRGRTYYIKVRSYKYVNGKIVYGAFSSIKKIKA